MLQKLKRKCRSAIILLMEGFTISMMSVLIGISAVNSILISLSETSSDAPIILTMQNTGLSFAFSIYLFSIASCLVVTNYWIITRRRDMAIRKAFGWSNFHLVSSIIKEMAEILFVSLCFSGIMIALLSSLTSGLFSIRLTPFFMLGTLVLLLFTLSVSVIIPVTQILKIHPAEVIG